VLDEHPSLPFPHAGREKSCGRSPLTRYGALSIVSLACSAVEGLVNRVKALAQKYSTTFAQVDEEISHEKDEFAGLLSKLTGDDYGMVGIRELCSLLRGDAR
jgi:hypothetical protein